MKPTNPKGKRHFLKCTYFDADRCGREGLEILRVEQVAAVRRQHLYDPDGEPFSLALGIRGRGAGRGCGKGRFGRSCAVWLAARVGGAALRGLAA